MINCYQCQIVLLECERCQKLNRKPGWTPTSPQCWGSDFFLQKFKRSMHSDVCVLKTFPTFENANRFPTTGLHPNTVCWKHQVLRDVDRKINLLRGAGVILTLSKKKKKGNWETFVKRCEKYGPKLNPGSVIFVDGNFFGVVEMVGPFQRELCETTVGSISRSVLLAPRPGHATSPKPSNRWKIIDYGWTVRVYHRVLWSKVEFECDCMPKINNIYWSFWELRMLTFARRAEMFFVILFGSFWLFCL